MTSEETFKFFHKFDPQISLEEAKVLYNAVMDIPEGPVVEIGSACGGSTIVLIGAAEEVGKMVYSIDPYPEELEEIAIRYTPGLMKEFKDKFRNSILSGPWKNIVQFNEDVAHCIDKIPNNLSLIFIDGLHELSFIQKDFILLFPKLVSEGCFYIHDTWWERGQLSNTWETANCHIFEWLNLVNEVVADRDEIITMLRCRKR